MTKHSLSLKIIGKINLIKAIHMHLQKYVFIIPLSKVELEVTLDSEGRDRVFRVTIKWVAQVSRVLVPRRRSLVSTRTANY